MTMKNLTIDAMPMMVQNYARLFGVSVRIQGSTAYTNGKVITIPRLNIKDPIVARLAYGYLSHESAHIAYTDFSILKKDDVKYNIFMFTLFNILEDCRIETLISKKYIGVHENLALLNNYYKDEWKTFLKDVDNIGVLRVISAYIQVLGQKVFQHYKSASDRAELLAEHLKTRVSEDVLNSITDIVINCASATNSEDILKACRKIYKLLSQKEDFSKFKKNDFADDLKTSGNYDDYKKIALETSKLLGKKKKYTADFASQLALFRQETKDDETNATPNKGGANCLEINSISKRTSSREDFGYIDLPRASAGSENFIDCVKNSYGLRNSLRQFVKGKVQKYGSHCETSNRIDALRAQRIQLGETKIFKDREVTDDYANDIIICVDASSSMLTGSDSESGSRLECANKVALSLALALENIDNVNVSVLYFPGQCSECELALDFGEKAKVFAPNFDQKPRGSTPLAQCLWQCFQKFEECSSSCHSKQIVCITDGMPDSVSNVKNAFEYAEKNGIDIYGISIQSELILKLFDKCVIIENENELNLKAYAILRSLFENQKKQITLDKVA